MVKSLHRFRASRWTGDRDPSAMQVLFSALLILAFGFLIIGVIVFHG